MSQTLYVSKVLAAASSTGLGSISTAAGGTVTLLSTITLDTARRITVASASLSGPSYVVTGLNQAGNVISETIVPSTTVVSIATTTQDFIRVTSVSLSSAISANSSGGFIIGTNTQGGTPWAPINTVVDPTAVSFQLQITAPSTLVAASFETTFDYPSYDLRTNTWGGGAPTTGPRATISSLGSTVTSSGTTGLISAPIAAWRVTVTSSSSSAGSVLASVLQSGY